MELKADLVIADRFRLVRMIGQGGMGTVWQARHLGLDMDCAIKFIEGDAAKLDDIKTRFEREAKAAAQLKSPNVVQVLDHGVWENIPFIAMELLDGEDLAARMASGRMAYVELCGIVGQVCRALSRAHQTGIIHRDLKPDNIFIVRDDDREIAKILDFGIAKHTRGEISGTNTKTGTMLGTPYYMSPEQAQGTKAVDSRSDLWSLAVIVFQVVCGRLPFESEALGDLLVKIIVAPIPVPSQVAAYVPPGFDAWWARASSRDPERRFQSARDFSDSLAIALGVGLTEDTSGILRMRQTHGSAPTSDQMRGVAAAHPASSGQVHVAPVTMPTFAGAQISAFLPQKRSPLVYVGAVAGGLLAVALVVGLIARGSIRESSRAAAAGPTSTEVPATAIVDAPAPVAVATAAEPPAAVAASAEPPTPPVSTATKPNVGVATAPLPKSTPILVAATNPPPPAAPTTAKPQPSARVTPTSAPKPTPKKPDLGF